LWLRASQLILALLLLFSVIGTSYAAIGGILYNNFSANSVTLRQMNPDGSGDTKVQVGLQDPWSPTWSRDGRLISLSSQGSYYPYSNSYNAFVFNPATGGIPQITSWKDRYTGKSDDYIVDYSWASSIVFSSDGARLGVVSIMFSEHWWLEGGYWYVTYLKYYPKFEVYDMQGKHAAVTVGDGLTSAAMHQGDGLDWVPNEDLLICPWQVTGDSSPTTALVAVAPVHNALDAGRFRRLTTPQFFQYSGKHGVAVCYDQDFQPAVAPHSHRVVYVRERDCIDGGYPVSPSTISVRMVNLNGTGDRAIYAVPRGKYVSHLSWAPDESKLVLSCGAQVVTNGWPMPSLDNTTGHIALLNPDGTGYREIAGPYADYPAWDPLGPVILPAPSLTNISPAAVTAGGKGFNLTVNGKGFNGPQQPLENSTRPPRCCGTVRPSLPPTR